MSDHYFSAQPAADPRRYQLSLRIDGRRLALQSAPGVFSGRHVDEGTQVLLDKAPRPPASGTLLDLGCGYGPIACALAVRAPAARVVAVDVNERALALTRENAAAHRLGNVTAAAPGDVDPALRFDRLYSNPPIRIGKPALHEMLATWLSRLADGGVAYLVVHRNLGSDSLQRWLSGEGYDASRHVSVRGFRVLAVRPGGSTSVNQEERS